MNTHWRSRDAYKASFMNIFALTDLQKTMAEKISKKLGAEVSVGRYVDISDSFHIYGSYFEEFSNFM
jgi:thymidylate synthase